MLHAMSGHHQRRSARVPLEIRVEFGEAHGVVAEFTRDISGGGVFVRTDAPLPVGTEARFSLTLPRMEVPVVLRGVVRRVVAPGRDDTEAGMGVEMLFVDDTERAMVKRVVDALMIEHLGQALWERFASPPRGAERG